MRISRQNDKQTKDKEKTPALLPPSQGEDGVVVKKVEEERAAVEEEEKEERLTYTIEEKQPSKVRFFDQIQIKQLQISQSWSAPRTRSTGARPVRACPPISPTPVIDKKVEPS